MEQSVNTNLKLVKDTLTLAEKYENAANIVGFDLETICPEKAMEHQGETASFLSNEAYKLIKSEEFIAAAESLYENRLGGEGACLEDRLTAKLAEYLHEDYGKIKNITPEEDLEYSRIFNQAYIDWLNAKNASDFSLFRPSLEKVIEVEKKIVSKYEVQGDTPYDTLLNDYERGLTSADLDEYFGACKERLLPLLERIKASKKEIRTDFLSRPSTEEQQKNFARYLLEVIGYDFTRGAFTTTEHPFTSELARDDVRVTTNYRDDISSSMYSIVHEGGHALFGQLQPDVHHDYFIADRMTMGMHESVSRFYENRIGRSEAFISLIYPEMKKIFPGNLAGVSERELFEAVNLVTPSLIRTESDEFTYTLHVIIRYEIEKQIVNEGLAVEKIPALWNQKYQEYLGITPPDDRRGVLQDVHWSGGFGYFPTYAIGNLYNSMYYNRMAQDFDVAAAVAAGDFARVNGWMAEHVFASANLLKPKEWIVGITGRELTPDDFLTYLEEKFGDLYEL